MKLSNEAYTTIIDALNESKRRLVETNREKGSRMDRLNEAIQEVEQIGTY